MFRVPSTLKGRDLLHKCSLQEVGVVKWDVAP